jgi:hypothetical protein
VQIREELLHLRACHGLHVPRLHLWGLHHHALQQRGCRAAQQARRLLLLLLLLLLPLECLL